MFKRFVLLIVTVLLATFSAYAESKHYRSGVILAAEITKANISVANLSSLAFPNMPQNKAYAVISVKLDSARELSIFDYSSPKSFLKKSIIAFQIFAKKWKIMRKNSKK